MQQYITVLTEMYWLQKWSRANIGNHVNISKQQDFKEIYAWHAATWSYEKLAELKHAYFQDTRTSLRSTQICIFANNYKPYGIAYVISRAS